MGEGGGSALRARGSQPNRLRSALLHTCSWCSLSAAERGRARRIEVLVAGELEDIGTRLREERDRVGISQRELARRIGVSASMISQIESGLSKPSVSTLYGIVTELGVSVDEIFGGANGSALEPGGEGTADPAQVTDHGPMVRIEDRHVIDLDSGVRWE